MTITREQVIEKLERSEHPYQGWMNDYPDLRERYFARLSPSQQSMVNFLNAHPELDLWKATGTARPQ